jgi:hypothetical protein
MELEDYDKPKKRFRRHTKEERKREKTRHKEKKREENSKARNQRKVKLVSNIAIQTDQLQCVSASAVSKATLPSRGAQMLIASKQINAERPAGSEVRKPASRLPVIRPGDLATPEKGKRVQVGQGSYGTCEFMLYRGNIPVVVKSYRSRLSCKEVNGEAKALLSLQTPNHHPCLPLLLEVHVLDKPYLLVTQFHGNGQTSHTVSSAIKAVLLKNKGEWYVFLEKLVKAVSFMHSKKMVAQRHQAQQCRVPFFSRNVAASSHRLR